MSKTMIKTAYVISSTGSVDLEPDEFEDCETPEEVRSLIIEACELHMCEQNMPGVRVPELKQLAEQLFLLSREIKE
jgi:hypothetical protein